MSKGVIREWQGGDDNKHFWYGGWEFKTQNADKAYSLSKLDGKTLRFEVRNGDIAIRPADVVNGKDRSEIATVKRFGKGKIVTVEYEFYVEGGTLNSNPWTCLGQWKGTDQNSEEVPDGAGRGPHCTFKLDVGDRPYVELRYGEYGDVTTLRPWSGGKIVRSRWHSIKMKTLFLRNGKGFVKIWYNTYKIVDYDGPVGYNDSSFFKLGVYREHSPEVLAVRYRNFDLTVEN